MRIKTSAFKGFAAALALTTLPIAGAQAQDSASPQAQAGFCNADRAAYRGKVFIPYIKAGATLDGVTEAGLKRLAAEATERTSIDRAARDETIHVRGIDIENDDICHFKFLYWPITQDSAPLSPEAQLKVEDYLARGKFIVFDVRDAGVMDWREAVQNVLGRVNLGEMEPMGEGHLLRHVFYRNSALPGSQNMSAVQVQVPLQNRGDPSAQVVVGERNWASAWAGLTLVPKSAAYEQSIRGGINLLIYALTGNYKGDQSDEILQKIERSGP